MKTLAIIAEYNPFHNGHKYHLGQAREISGADYAITIMSGNFLQRGHAAMWDKYTRAKMCTESGIDLALELPFCYATGSAMDFANGSVSILNQLGSVDYLCFGAETDSLQLIERIADTILEEPDGYSDILRTKLAKGMSYPAARETALTSYINNSDINEVISSPNNILAIEYVCSLKRTASRIKPVLIPRKQAGYHDPALYGNISSATAIRNLIESDCSNSEAGNSFLLKLKHEIPESTFNIINDTLFTKSPVFTDDLTPFLQSNLLSGRTYNNICDITDDLANKIYKLAPNISFTDAMSKLKSRDITLSRISRCLIHLILNYTDTDRTDFIDNGYGFYANILSFRKNSSNLLKVLNQTGTIPLITKKADFECRITSLDEVSQNSARRMWELDTRATNLYNCLILNRYGTICTNDYNTPIPIISP